MDGHFRAFSFVDRITAIQADGIVRGSYAIPAHLPAFWPSLVAESIGQCAAWAAMAQLGFAHRPVAGIAGEIEILALAQPGQVLELTANLETVDNDAVAYGGSASVAGRPVLRLHHCVGPMMPLETFDDPEAMKARFALLRGAGATPGVFPGVPPLALESLVSEMGCLAAATLRVPEAAPFFGDHFPRRPVFPGTLLMHQNLELASILATQTPALPGSRWIPRTVRDVKIRSFTAPGETLLLTASFEAQTPDSLTIGVESRRGKRVVGGAQVIFRPEATP